MYSFLKGFLFIIIGLFFSLLFSAASVFIFKKTTPAVSIILSAFTFLILSSVCLNFISRIKKSLFSIFILKGSGISIYNFSERIKVLYSREKMIEELKRLEDQLGFKIFWMVIIDEKNYHSIYQNKALSQDVIKTAFNLIDKKSDGIYLLNKDMKIAQNLKLTNFILFRFYRNVFMFNRKGSGILHNRLIQNTGKELALFLKRLNSVEKMFSLSFLSKQWKLLAQTQKFFLPPAIPIINGLDIDIFYKPFINVGGDYYDIIRLNDEETLIVLGDVSGKGLSAAIIMGIIINSIKISEDKRDLRSIAESVNEIIRVMRFKGKFTALFLGLFNNKTRNFKYVNAGIPYINLIREYTLLNLPAESHLLGIFKNERIKINIKEIDLKNEDVIVMCSDGITELEDKEGIMLVNSNDYKKKLMLSSGKASLEIREGIMDLVSRYDKKRDIRDDITLIVVRVIEGMS